MRKLFHWNLPFFETLENYSAIIRNRKKKGLQFQQRKRITVTKAENNDDSDTIVEFMLKLR